MALLAVNAARPLELHIPSVLLTNKENETRIKVDLPLDINLSRPDIGQSNQYRLQFTLRPEDTDYTRGIVFKTTGCFQRVSINGEPAALLRPPRTKCVATAYYPLPQESQQPLRVRAQLSSGSWVNLSVYKAPWITPQWSAFLLILAGLLLYASYARGNSLNYRAPLAAVMLFICSLAFPPPQFWPADIWLRFLAPQLAMVCVLGVLLYTGYANRFMDRAGGLLSGAAHWPFFTMAIASLLFLGVAAALSQFLFDGMPHIADTHAQFIHSKIMASGHLFAEPHPLKEFFSAQSMIDNVGRLFSNYLPGHIILLALGQLAGFPWLVNPLLGALTLPVIALLAKEIGGRGAGMIAALLTLLSPFILFMSSEYMNHATCLLFTTLFMLAYLRLLRTRHWGYALIAGAAIGMVFITRPQNAVAFALPAAVHALWLCRKQPAFLMLALGIVTAFLPFAGFLAYYADATFGNALFPMLDRPAGYAQKLVNRVQTGESNDWQRLWGQARGLHTFLFGWPGSSLSFVTALFVLRLPGRHASLVMWCCLSQLISLLLVPYNDFLFGPRYLYECSGCLIALTAVCLARLPTWASGKIHLPENRLRGALGLMIAFLFMFAFIGHDRDRFYLYARNYWEGNPSYVRLIERSVQKPALVFMNSKSQFRLVSDSLPPDDNAPVIYAHDLGKDNDRLRAYYPDRHAYIVLDEKITPVTAPISDSAAERKGDTPAPADTEEEPAPDNRGDNP